MEIIQKQFSGNIVRAYNYQKHDGGSHSNPTGYILEANTSPYAVFDFDPHMETQDERNEWCEKNIK